MFTTESRGIPLTDAGRNRVSGRVVVTVQRGEGVVDLVRDRRRVEFVKVAGGSSGEELRSAHAEGLSLGRGPFEGGVGDGDRSLDRIGYNRV
jgi:hypothetical protein